MRIGLATLALISCRHDAPQVQPQPISNSVPAEPGDPRCSDELIGTLRTTDPGYLISPDELVARTMRDHANDFRLCVLRRRHELPAIGGKLVVTIHTDAAGKPARVETRGPDSELDRCICAEVLTLTFGLASSTVSYPMFFSAVDVQ